jgi:hypothetical protein
MATQTITTKPNNGSAAQWAVEVDGVFCVLVGALFLLDANGVNQFMGAQSTTFIGALGLGTLLYGFGLLYDVVKGKVNTRLLQVAIGLDVLWVVGSIILLVAAPAALNSEGRWTVLILADIVGIFGIWQYVGLRRLNR